MKRKLMKNLILIVAMVVLCFAVGVTASAEIIEDDYIAVPDPPVPVGNLVDGVLTAGENLTWSFDEATGTLTISGEGPMYDFVQKDNKDYVCPWKDFRNAISSVIINEGVTTIGHDAFSRCENMTNVSIPDGVTNIGESAFSDCINLKSLEIPKTVNTIKDYAFANCVSLTDVVIENSVENVGNVAFMNLPFLERMTIKSIELNLGQYYPFCANEYKIVGISRDAFFELYNKNSDKINDYIIYAEDPSIPIMTGTIYCHAGSTAEAYAIENGVDYVLTHFFEGDWTYDYDNMIRFRKCIHCDEIETELLETTTDSDVEIIEPTDPNTDFVVDVITDYVVIEETISNNITTDFEIIKAFDINLKNKDGVHVQPDGTVKVKLPNDWSKSGVYKVYRVNDDGTLTDMNAYREGSHMVFDTDHFSIYVIVDESAKADAPTDTPDEPQEETKDNFFSKIIDLIKAFFELIASCFKK